jgi:hypothetical protein
MMEAMLVAAGGRGRILSEFELRELVDGLGFHPSIERLNEK